MPEIVRIDIGGGFRHIILVNRLILIVLCANPRSAYECPRSYPNFGRAGRAISAPSMALVCKVIGRAKRRDGWWFYLDDGVYGAQSGAYSMECITGCRYSRRVTSNQRAYLLDQLVIRLMNLEGIRISSSQHERYRHIS